MTKGRLRQHLGKQSQKEVEGKRRARSWSRRSSPYSGDNSYPVSQDTVRPNAAVQKLVCVLPGVQPFSIL